MGGEAGKATVMWSDMQVVLSMWMVGCLVAAAWAYSHKHTSCYVFSK
jgi:hypothetical protein